MAMTRAEKERMTALETELAFRWPGEAEPVRTVVPESGKDAVGWDFNAYSGIVEKYWSTTISHGRFHEGKKAGGSQNSRRLYATRNEAIIALRWAACREMARKLYAIDQMRADDSEGVKP